VKRLATILMLLACFQSHAAPPVFDDVSALDGLFIVNETISDNPAIQSVPNPVTWNTAVTNDFRFDCFTVAVTTGLWGGSPGQTVARSAGSGAVLVSPSVCVVAGHVPGTGDAYVWMTSAGTEITRSRAWGGHLPGADADDYSVMVLNEPITQITPVKILASTEWLEGEEVASLEHDRHVNVMSVGRAPGDPDLSNTNTNLYVYRPAADNDAIEGGDSGKPTFAFIDGEPVLVITAFYAAGTAGIPANSYAYGPNPSSENALPALRALVESLGEELDIVIDTDPPPEPTPLPPGDYLLRGNNNQAITIGGVPVQVEVD
jgi:hypothetical protein